jgi:transposase
MRTPGPAALLEYRRRTAVRLVLDGESAADAARVVGVTARSVERWASAFAGGGDAALAVGSSPGRPPKLTPAEAAEVVSWVGRDAREFGFDVPCWTAPRLAAAVEARLGVSFSPKYLSAWVAARRVTPQVPALVPRERDDAAVARWVAVDWERAKKRPAGTGPPSASRTRAGS